MSRQSQITPRLLAACLALAACLLALPLASASAAPSPWWQITTGSHPTNLSPAASGRLLITLTNLGDAPLDATGTPLTILDQLPEGVKATGYAAKGGVEGNSGPVHCEVKAADLLTCSFEDLLTSYESIQLEVLVDVDAAPPAEPAPGKVSVSGADGPPKSVPQPIVISSDPTPFGFERFSAQAEEEGGGPAEQAGGHPFQLTTIVQLNSGHFEEHEGGVHANSTVEQPAQPRELRFPLPAGFLGNVRDVPTCGIEDFIAAKSPQEETINKCPDATVVGATSVEVAFAPLSVFRPAVPVFNLPPAAGQAARFGFTVARVPTVIDFSLDPDDQYRLIATVHNVSQAPKFLSAILTIWGNPGDPRHDSARGWACVYNLTGGGQPCERPANLSEAAFLRLPVSCATPLDFGAALEPWNLPAGTLVDQEASVSPNMSGCNQVPFDPKVTAAPSTKLAANPSGLDYRLEMPNAGLLSSDAIAEGQAKRVEVTLPAGMTLNPSQAEGLATCSPAQYASERYNSTPGAGCPDAAKIGEVKVQTPLLSEEARGSVYVATPYENPFDSLIALYIIARIPERGILVKQAGVVTPDPVSGQITTSFDDLPQLPFSSFDFRFRSGSRAPLVTPPACGDFDLTTRFVPWSAADPENPSADELVTRTSSFEIERGAEGGECPSGATPPFKPRLSAGTTNNAAGSFSPFNIRLTRSDAEQEFTNFSIKLPPGIAAKLAGVPFCPEAQIAQATARTGPHGGAEELADPSCPAPSQVGATLAGAGVGGSLAYAPGKVYLAGPYHGAPISFVSVTSALVGPFDIGTVVVRLALKVNPETGEVFLDSTGSDPIPHIIKGVVLHLRDIRAYTDRPSFTFNPTSCEPTSTSATVLGSGLDFVSAADDNPFVSSSRFQAADCAALPFRPKLSLKLKGQTKRAGNPALHAHLTMAGMGPTGANESGLAYTRVTLPKTLFLDNAHIGTVCTRVQFKAGAIEGERCPAGSVIGSAKAITPILEAPLEGPIYLRSNPERELPDIAASLRGSEISVVAVGHTDSAKGGGLRNTFEVIPDAPITSVDINLLGGKRGLIESSRNLCSYKPKARVEFKGHNGKAFNPTLAIKATGCKGRKRGRR